jgi:phosphatidylglycerophosphate synthase
MKHIANCITAARIAASLALLLTKPLSAGFYAVYILCGVTDMIDGPVARRTGTESRTGATLDSIADTVFVAVCLYQLLPVIALPRWLWVWIGVIAALKVLNIVSGYFCRHAFTMLHTSANKATGAVLFLLPLTMGYAGIKIPAVCACALATFAAVQEGHFIRTGRGAE